MSFVTTSQPAESICGSSLQTQQTDSVQHLNAQFLPVQDKSFKKHRPAREYKPWPSTRWQRSASESKRRCLSSLQVSPLNLSVVHPCKPNKRILSTASECAIQSSLRSGFGFRCAMVYPKLVLIDLTSNWTRIFSVANVAASGCSLMFSPFFRGISMHLTIESCHGDTTHGISFISWRPMRGLTTVWWIIHLFLAIPNIPSGN